MIARFLNWLRVVKLEGDIEAHNEHLALIRDVRVQCNEDEQRVIEHKRRAEVALYHAKRKAQL